MMHLESAVFAYWLNSLWQVPLVFLAACLAARLVHQMGPHAEHRVWVAALLLQAILPMCIFHLGEVWRQAWAFMLSLWSANTPGGQTQVVFGNPAVFGMNVGRMSAGITAGLILAYIGSVAYFSGRMGWALYRTSAMRKQASAVVLDGESERSLSRFSQFFRLSRRKIHVAASSQISGPVTVGISRWTLLLPPKFLESMGRDDLDTVFAHECAHLQRRDFAWNLLFGLIALPIAYHPLLWLTRSRIAESREMVCDAMAAEAMEGRERYARSLLRVASMLSHATSHRSLHAIGIFDTSIFERRIMNLTRKHFEVRGLQRVMLMLTCGVLGLLTCASALALHIDTGVPVPAQTKQPKRVFVSSGVMQGNLIHKVMPVYPDLAKKGKIEGTVVLAAHINKDGEPESLQVKSGPPLLEQSALDAVRQWRWKPYLLNGNPVDVETEINVIYSLGK
ncbi:MAG TPA: M56 family metallopeptidase [Alloacidobacterium sp.]|nr:M56 family metallopeptidase [Alloacidobacterium sp.]